MKNIKIKSFAKINLTLDVLGLLPNGYHEVEMIMQQIALCDDVTVKWKEDSKMPMAAIELTVSRKDLPADESNLAYKAAMLMAAEYGSLRHGIIDIDIRKNIPIAAGLAGGSSNCAAVIHALNQLWDLNLSLKELCSLGARLGSDVPFCIMGQAAANESLEEDFSQDELSCHCALAYGTGTDLKPLKGLNSHIALSKPDISVSTAAVYKGIDSEEIPVRPNNYEMITALEEKNYEIIQKNMVNVLENFTLKSYPNVMYTKNIMSDLCNLGYALMSGSGPSVFCLCETAEEADEIRKEMLKINKESFSTRTTH